MKKSRHTARTMARKKQDVTKESRIDVRMHPALHAALTVLAKSDGRTLSSFCERRLRQLAITEMKARKLSVEELEQLP